MKNAFFDEWWKQDAISAQDMSRFEHGWAWIFSTGVAYLILGVIALALPMISTLGVTFGLAAILIVGGLTHLVHAVQLRNRLGGSARLFQSIVAIVAGGLILRYPAGGMISVALALSLYFFISATAQWILFSNMRPHRGWGWGIASSIISLFLGVYIIAAFPFSALWVPGTLLGIDLVFAGSAMIGIALSARSVQRRTFRPPADQGSPQRQWRHSESRP